MPKIAWNLHSYRTLFALKRISLPPNSVEFSLFFFPLFDWPKKTIVLNFWHSLIDRNSLSSSRWLGFEWILFALCFVHARYYSLVDVGESNDRCEFKHLYSIASFCHHNILYFKKNPSSRLASMFYSQKMVYFWFQEKIQYKFSLSVSGCKTRRGHAFHEIAHKFET